MTQIPPMQHRPSLDRRQFTRLLLAGGAMASLAQRRRPSRVLILGGGPAGATAALALARAGHDVALMERDPTRLARTRALPVEARAYARPTAGPTFAMLIAAGVEILLDEATGIDWRDARVEGFSGRRMAFDRLLLAPGTTPVASAMPGLDARARHVWPAALGSGTEARRLAARLASIAPDQHLVLRLPAKLSHPQVAMDRAHRLSQIAAQKGARFTVLDGGAHAPLPGIRWLGPEEGGRVLSIDTDRGLIETSAGRIRADVVNFMTPRAAGRIAQASGLTDVSGWCPCDPGGTSALRAEAVILGDARRDAPRTLAAAMGQV